MTYSRTLIMALACFTIVSCAFEPSAQAVEGTAVIYREASHTLLNNGHKALEEKDYKNALSLFESALVADPGNVQALVAIGQVHEAMGQRSTGLGYYRRALVIEPESRAALAAESLAFLADDGLVKAEQNRDRLKRLCGNQGCLELREVESAIDAYKASHIEESASSATNDQDKS